MEPLVLEAILSLVDIALKQLSKNEKLQQKAMNGAQRTDDRLQQFLGNVNTYTLEEAIQTAISTAVIRDKETTSKIIAIVSILYFTNRVPRGAICAGTLLKYIGCDTFPHIDEKELRFAKELNIASIEAVTGNVMENYDEALGDYNVAESVDYSALHAPAASQAAIQNIANPVIKHGSTVFSIVNKIRKLF